MEKEKKMNKGLSEISTNLIFASLNLKINRSPNIKHQNCIRKHDLLFCQDFIY